MWVDTYFTLFHCLQNHQDSLVLVSRNNPRSCLPMAAYAHQTPSPQTLESVVSRRRARWPATWISTCIRLDEPHWCLFRPIDFLASGVFFKQFYSYLSGLGQQYSQFHRPCCFNARTHIEVQHTWITAASCERNSSNWKMRLYISEPTCKRRIRRKTFQKSGKIEAKCFKKWKASFSAKEPLKSDYSEAWTRDLFTFHRKADPSPWLCLQAPGRKPWCHPPRASTHVDNTLEAFIATRPGTITWKAKDGGWGTKGDQQKLGKY